MSECHSGVYHLVIQALSHLVIWSLMVPALSQVCTLHAPFEKDVEDFAAGHCEAIEIWLGKLETYLQSHSVDDVRQLLEKHHVAAPVASFQGGLLISQGEARKEHWNHFAKRLELDRKSVV